MAFSRMGLGVVQTAFAVCTTPISHANLSFLSGNEKKRYTVMRLGIELSHI